MKNYSPLTYKDLKRMDELLKTPGTTLSENNQLTELDWLAIKTSNDIIEHPKRIFYSLRMFNYQNKTHQNSNSENLIKLSLKG